MHTTSDISTTHSIVHRSYNEHGVIIMKTVINNKLTLNCINTLMTINVISKQKLTFIIRKNKFFDREFTNILCFVFNVLTFVFNVNLTLKKMADKTGNVIQ